MSECKHKINDDLCLLHSDMMFYKELCRERLCHDYTAMTNAGRIRVMTDEKLAEWFHNNTTICPPGLKMKECTKGVKYCLNCWLDWLKQDVNNGN